MILGDYFSLNHEIILATGLSQSPSDNPIFYYRLKDHSKFLKYFMIEFKNVYPRMTRDFLIEFEDNEKKDKALNILQNIMLNKKNKIFNQIEIREKSLFVTLDYSNEIQKKDEIFYETKKINFFDCVSFVALKNGEHNEKGYFYSSKNINDTDLIKDPHVKNIFNVIKKYFNVK